MGSDKKVLYGLSNSARMFLGGLLFSLLILYLTKPFFCGIDNFQSKKNGLANWFKDANSNFQKGIKKGTDNIMSSLGYKKDKTEKKKKKKKNKKE